MVELSDRRGSASSERDLVTFTNILYDHRREEAEKYLAKRPGDEILQMRARVIFDVLEGQSFGVFDDTFKNDLKSGG